MRFLGGLICSKALDSSFTLWYDRDIGGIAMKISTKGRYALRVMIDLAEHD